MITGLNSCITPRLRRSQRSDLQRICHLPSSSFEILPGGCGSHGSREGAHQENVSQKPQSKLKLFPRPKHSRTCDGFQATVHEPNDLPHARSKNWKHISIGTKSWNPHLWAWALVRKSIVRFCSSLFLVVPRCQSWNWHRLFWTMNGHDCDVGSSHAARHNTSHSDLFEKSELLGRALEACERSYGFARRNSRSLMCAFTWVWPAF